MLIALHGCAALLVVVIGVLGLLGASWPRQMLESWINVHALFCVLLCGLVLAEYQRRVRQSTGEERADSRELSRRLSRMVYLLLYVVIGLRQIISILHSLWHGGAVDLSPFDERFRNGPDYAGFNPKDDFQLFFASGLLALIVVRILAFGLRLRSVARPASPKAATGVQLEADAARQNDHNCTETAALAEAKGATTLRYIDPVRSIARD